MEWVYGSWPVRYWYNDENGEGILEDGTSIAIKHENLQVSRFKLFSMRHKNLWLPDIGDIDTGWVLYTKGGCTFNDYLANNPFVFEFFLPISPTLENQNHPQVSIRYVSNEFRGFCRGLVKLFIHMHTFNVALIDSELDFSDLVVLNGKLILTKPNFFETNNDDWRKQDFRKLANVFQTAFDYYGDGQPPLDFSDLLDCLRNYNHGLGDYMFLKNHLALLKTPKRLSMIRGFREKRKKISEEDYRYILESMSGCEHDWTTDFCDNFRPEFGVANDCYKHTRKGESQPVYYLTEDERQEPADLRYTAIRFARDMVVHIPDNIWKYRDQDQDQSNEYEEMELEMTSMYFFTEHLLSFHRAIHHLHMLHVFMEY